MEKILEIKEYSYNGWDGFTIKTDKQTITLFIDNIHSYCESFGFLTSEDDFVDFIGAELIGVTKIDDKLRTCSNITDDEKNYLFINVNTSIGLLQFTAYNFHNGYYGNQVKITSNQLSIDENI